MGAFRAIGSLHGRLDQTGSVRWSVSNDQPFIAIADGGVIGSSGSSMVKMEVL